MHEHLEMFLPPQASENIEVWITNLLTPFAVHYKDEQYGDPNPYAFYDYYRIGGGYAGRHLLQRIDPDGSRTREIWADYRALFDNQKHRDLDDEAVELRHRNLWRNHFPDGGPICPLFQSNVKVESDICLVGELAPGLTAARMFVAQNRNGDTAGELPEHLNMHSVCFYMLCVEVWNGANLQRTDWNGLVSDGIERQQAHVRQHYRQEFYQDYAINDDWLVATIDYHR